MGRRGKPVATHKKEGTYNVTRHGRGGLRVRVPEMPGDLTPVEQAFWKFWSQLLLDAGIITELDGPVLRLAAEQHDLRCEFRDEIRKRGAVIQGQSSPVANPAIGAYYKAAGLQFKILQAMGGTELARRGMDFGEQDDGIDADTARILKLKQA